MREDSCSGFCPATRTTAPRPASTSRSPPAWATRATPSTCSRATSSSRCRAARERSPRSRSRSRPADRVVLLGFPLGAEFAAYYARGQPGRCRHARRGDRRGQAIPRVTRLPTLGYDLVNGLGEEPVSRRDRRSHRHARRPPHLQDGRGRSRGAARRRAHHQARRVRGHPRPVRLGQDDAPEPPRRHRRADERLDHLRRARHLAPQPPRTHAVPARAHRLRLPVLQPDPHADRRGERPLRPRARRARRRRPGPRPRRAPRQGRTRRAGPATSPRSSPAASSSASRSRARWPRRPS